ncbi:MAG: hypothetical protein LBH74_06965 [Nitrososphaerota archaeon]|jgi:hypothetical protein|uniref:hypothetical protein n=1 Tax=Candidatus Bathycorpusculum sp. TaxID=2994959 RepID=UPI00282CC53D|nr:hypothetical protein [Candidatus Termitimicrobium sp.]MCL2432464.1 hypothetical protein [Candidatus Termitimicrobium sp.]MDR0493358.1 hypothetical protein [Nitrososphaerota archaeon]
MESDKVTPLVVLLLIGEIVAILSILVGSLIVVSAIFSAVNGIHDVAILGIGIELQFIGAGVVFLTHRAINNAHCKQEDTQTT